MIVLAAVALLLISSFQEGTCEETCQTKSCLETADRVLNSMNEKANPCEDFYEFACRGWIRNNPIPKHRNQWSRNSAVMEDVELRLYRILNEPDKEEDGRPIKMARALYASCVDFESVEKVGLKPLVDALTTLGLPLTPPTDEEAANLDIPRIAGSAIRHYGINMFFQVNVGLGSNNTTPYRLELDAVSPIRPYFDNFLMDPVKYSFVLNNEKNYILKMLQAGGSSKNNDMFAIEVINFAIEMSKILLPLNPRISANYTYPIVTIMELQKLTDPDVKHWNWTKCLNALFEQTGVVVDPTKDTAVIQHMSYFKKLPLVMSKISRGTIARYLWWIVYARIAPNTVQKFRNLRHFHFGKQPDGFDGTWYGCTDTVNKFFGNALTAAYVEKHLKEEYKKSAMKMWTELVSSFDEMLTEYKWMDNETKARAHVKLRAMRPLIGYPEWVTDPKKLEEYYKEYEVVEGSLAQTYINLNSINKKRMLNRWKQISGSDTWLISTTQPTIQSVARENTVTVGAGGLHEPFHGNAAEALNYGALGALLANKVTHGFDGVGQVYTENGTVGMWWSDAALKHFNEQVDCVVKQYSEYNISQLHRNFTPGGIGTNKENVADIGGLAIAHRAYKKLKATSQPERVIPGLAKYTDDQLFFLGWAQASCDSFTNAALEVHTMTDSLPPGRIRSNGALQNNAEFATAWKCPSGSPMNPEKKCNVW